MNNSVWIPQIVGAIVLAMAAWSKFTMQAAIVDVFTSIGMGVPGMMLIGILEIIATVLLIIPRLAATGALLGFGVMLGAMIAHLTKIGLPTGQGLLFFILALLSTAIVLWMRREEAPLMGKMAK